MKIQYNSDLGNSVSISFFVLIREQDGHGVIDVDGIVERMGSQGRPFWC